MNKRTEENTHIRGLTVACMAALVMGLIPMVVVAFCDVPSADDYGYGANAYHALQNGGGLQAVLWAAIQNVERYYRNWQGTFSAIFLFSLMPGIWGLKYYCLTPFLILFPIICGWFLLFRAVEERVFHKKCPITRSLAVIILLVFTQFLPDPTQGFYWYNGGIYYMFFFGLSMIDLALLLFYAQNGDRKKLIFPALLSFVIGGGNYVTAFGMVELLIFLLILMFWKENRNWKGILIPLFAILLAFLVSAAAPGNARRQAEYPDHPGAVQAIVESFTACLRAIGTEWLTLPLIGAILLMLPLIAYLVTHSERKGSFPLPGAVTLLSFCYLSSLFTPPMYAMGHDGGGRVLNVIYGVFLLLLTGNLGYWMGWMREKGKLPAISVQKLEKLELLGAMAAVVLIALAVKLQGETITSVSALGILRSGSAQRYYQEAEERDELLKGADTELIVPPVSEYPPLLFYSDIDSSPDSWENSCVEEYYGKERVCVP